MTAEPAAPPAPPRLLALRLQGFKSFAERTHVEFGGGISAIVGPNGSGKSNLADALRWALGEQGRALRSRKAEDVIWAGSETRAAQGMADVTLVLDNADALLPVDFGVLELGRRLFRSGENEYLLNKQRIRLRDLVDLLDAAHLADNAFLFIGQGMVDQALALRPEERRPLFEEVAGVRRHERRRRKAEEQLTESEANLARVEDILAELRPQARRLAAQAEQQATRSSAGDELAAALVQAAHARWHGAAARHAEANRTVADSRRDADAAMAALDAAETAAGALSAELAVRATLEAERRTAHDDARAALTALQLRDGRLAAELEALQRDESRLVTERAAAEAEATTQRRLVAAPVPARDLELESAVTAADRELAEALAELGSLRAASHADGEALAAVRRAEAARTAEVETARRRLDDAMRRFDEQGAVVSASETRRVSITVRHDTARAALEAASAAEAAAAAARETARQVLEAAEAERDTAADRAAKATTTAAALRGRVDALSVQVDDDERRPIARAARRVGGRRLDEELVVEPALRAAVEAALADRVRAYLVGTSSVAALATERGRLLIDEVVGRDLPTNDQVTRRWFDAVASAGGGPLVDAVRRDGTGVTRRLLARVAWAPDLATALELQPQMPGGGLLVTRDGTAVVDETGVLLGAPESTLERRAEHGRLLGELEAVEIEAAGLRTTADTTAAAADEARQALGAASDDERRRTAERRRAEEIERAAARELEASARESAWHAAQLERGEAEVARLRADVAALEPSTDTRTADQASPKAKAAPDDALAAWEARAGELRERRDRLAAQLAGVEERRRAAGHAQARAEAAAALAEERLSWTEREAEVLAERRSAGTLDRDAVRVQLAAAVATELAAREALAEVHAADAVDRTRLADADRTALTARERLRATDDRLRAADHAELEARLALEALREGVLVELAGLGPLGLAALGWTPEAESARTPGLAETTTAETDGVDRADGADDVALETAELEAALTAAAEAWAVESPPAAPPPGRLAQLRRRYHDLGAANPFAVEEYAELKARLELLEAQDGDLRTAIATTRELIEQLDTMIADQFRRTFEALEGAFERRFEQLFGGGFARLALTDPSDLTATGIEIIARPPGKKPQALAMLSGGERALTAVALLFAMLEVRPVPFCVLDEVDAALDEANIGRFAEALRSLADATQFIVITHNRGTIEAADAMYGVTVGDDSVSRVISLRLDEAQALADDRRHELAPAG